MFSFDVTAEIADFRVSEEGPPEDPLTGEPPDDDTHESLSRD